METFINTIRNNNVLLSFYEIVGNITQEESRMISKARIQKHEEGEPVTFVTLKKKKKGKCGPSREASTSTYKKHEG